MPVSESYFLWSRLSVGAVLEAAATSKSTASSATLASRFGENPPGPWADACRFPDFGVLDDILTIPAKSASIWRSPLQPDSHPGCLTSYPCGWRVCCGIVRDATIAVVAPSMGSYGDNTRSGCVIRCCHSSIEDMIARRFFRGASRHSGPSRKRTGAGAPQQSGLHRGLI